MADLKGQTTKPTPKSEKDKEKEMRGKMPDPKAINPTGKTPATPKR
jgi:hypothetical protein